MARGRLVGLKRLRRDREVAKLPETEGFDRAHARRPVWALGLIRLSECHRKDFIM